MFLATSNNSNDHKTNKRKADMFMIVHVRNCKKILGQINIIIVLSQDVFRHPHVNLVRCSYFEYADGISFEM